MGAGELWEGALIATPLNKRIWYFYKSFELEHHIYSVFKNSIHNQIFKFCLKIEKERTEYVICYRKDTPSNAAFTGSMQLLAGVKLCTERPLANHPHYEDKTLRQRTKEVRNHSGDSSWCLMCIPTPLPPPCLSSILSQFLFKSKHLLRC